MQKFIFTGNLTRDPESGVTTNGTSYCRFTVAVARRFEKGKADFFRVTAWRGLAENCVKYLRKGKKVAVTGEININEKDDKIYVQVTADEVEFLSPMSEEAPQKPTTMADMRPVEDIGDLPF